MSKHSELDAQTADARASNAEADAAWALAKSLRDERQGLIEAAHRAISHLLEPEPNVTAAKNELLDAIRAVEDPD